MPTADEIDAMIKEMEGSRPPVISEPVPEIVPPPPSLAKPEPKTADESYRALLGDAEEKDAMSWYQDMEEKAMAEMAAKAPAPPAGLGTLMKDYLPGGGMIPDGARQFLDVAGLPLTTAAGGALSAAKDIGTGLATEPHKIAVGGPAKGLNSMTDLAAQGIDALAKFLNDNVADLSQYDQYLPEFMKGPVRQVDAEGHVNGPIPTDWAKTDTWTGGIGQAIAQFMTGFSAAGGAGGLLAKAPGLSALPAAQGLAGALAVNTAKSAFSNMAAFDGHEANLANLIEMVPALQNPVTEFLASSPDDSDAVGRLKNGLAGFVPDMLIGGFVTGLQGIKFARRMKALTGEPTYEDAARKLETGASEPGEAYTAPSEAEMLVGGDDVPLWERAPLTTGADPAFEAKGLSKTATEGEYKSPALKEMTPAERAAVAASKPRPVSVVEIGGPEKPPTFAWSSPSKRDVTPVGLGNHDTVLRSDSDRRVLMGTPHLPPPQVVSDYEAAIGRVDYAIPQGTDVGVMTKAEAGRGGNILVTFKRRDGSTLTALMIPAGFKGRRAFATGDGAFIGFMRQGATPNELLRIDGEILHEVVHAGRIKKVFPDAEWLRLVGHGRSLRVMEMRWDDFYRAIGDEEIIPHLAHPEKTIADTYAKLYANHVNGKELMEQEIVAHMLELEVHGYWKPGQLSPVADVIKQLKAGAWTGKAGVPGARGAAAGGTLPAMAPEAKGGTVVYHGSEFKFDRFDPERIGRENGNTEGWGLYFSETKPGAEGYRANSTMADKTIPHTLTIGGKTLPATKENAEELARLAVDESGATGADAEAISELMRTAIAHKEDFEWAGAAAVRAGEMDRAVKTRALEAIGRVVTKAERGHLYEARLGVSPDDFAVWTDPVSKLAEAPRASLGTLGVQVDEAAPFSKLYAGLTTALGSKRAASEALVKAGIPGVKYRGGPGDGWNYVLYDTSQVTGLARDSQPLFASAAEIKASLGKLPEQGSPKEMLDSLIANGIPETDALIAGLRSVMAGRESVTRAEIEGWLNRTTMEAMTGPQQPNGEGPVYINLARISGPEDVKSVLQQMADAARVDGTVYGRGVRSNATTREAAEAENAFGLLIGERKGNLPLAEEQYALRQLWGASASKLLEVSKMVVASPTPERLVLFRRLMATHNLIQQEVIGIRTETARALQQWAIPSGAPEMVAKQLEQTLTMNGGKEMSEELARRIAGLAGKPGGMVVLDKFVRNGGFLATTRDMVYEAWRNALLSSPTTHVVNSVSNSATLLTSMIERAVAGRLSEMTGNVSGVQIGEATAMLWGSKQALRDAFIYLAKNRRFSGLYSDVAGTRKGPAPYETSPWNRAISKETMANSTSSLYRRMAASPMLGKGVDMLGSIVNTPGSMMMGADEFFKAINDRAQLWALAYRQAAQEAERGLIQPEALGTRITALILEPTPKMQMEAAEFAAYNTFTSEPGPITKKILELRAQTPGAGVILPFVATPANILKYSFERTPLAPLMARFREDVRAGGSRRDLAIAKMGLGSMVIGMAVDMGFDGSVTGGGPSDPGERALLMRSGWRPYSVRIETGKGDDGKGDDGKPTYRYVAYNRMDPVGYILGIGADLGEVMAYNGPEQADGLDEAVIAATLGAAESFTEKSYLTGFAGVVEAVSDAKRYGEGYADRTIASLIPSGIAAVTRQLDPYQKYVTDATSALKARTPGLSASVPNRVDFWGRDIKLSSGLGWGFDMLTPMKAGPEAKQEPIDKELLRLHMFPEHPASMVIEGESVSLRNLPEAKRAWVIYTSATPASELPAEKRKRSVDPITKYGDKTLLESLNELVSEERSDNPWIAQLQFDYQAATDDEKQDIVQKVIRHYRSAAKSRVMDEFPALMGKLKAQKIGTGKTGGASPSPDTTSPTLEP